MSNTEKGPLEQAVRELIEEFRRLRQENPDSYELKYPGVDPTALEKVLRVDTLTNEGEGQTAKVLVQFRTNDPNGNKPFLVPWLEVDLLGGGVSWGTRDDLTEGWSGSFGFGHLRGDDGKARLLAMKTAVAMMRRDGFGEAAELIEAGMDREKGLGWPRFEAAFHRWTVDQFFAAPAYAGNPYIHQGAMVPGQVYAFAHVPPRNWLFVKLARFVGYRDSGFRGESRYPKVEHPYLEFAVDDAGLTAGPHQNDLSCGISDHDGLNYRGTVFPVPEEMYRLALTFVSPQFDRNTLAVPIPMPAWTKSLDNVAACLERLRTKAFAYDEDQKFEALAFLAEHRDQLTEEVNFSVPSEPGNAFAKTKEERWQTIIDNSQKSCGCGCIRKLVPICPRTGFEPNEDGNAAVGLGQTAYLIPKDGEKEQALFSVRVIESGGQHYLTFLKDPFSESIDILGALRPKGYPLDRLAEAMENAAGDKPRLGVDKRIYCQILTVDLAAKQVWLTPDVSLRIEVEDK